MPWAEARCDGPAAKSPPVRSADLTAPHFQAHTEEDLFWFISHGLIRRGTLLSGELMFIILSWNCF
jgi:hypothetical protein